jgi:hypothetical protein
MLSSTISSGGNTMRSLAKFSALQVYNSIGQEVMTLVDGVVTAGVHQATWNAASLPSGVYIYRLATGRLVEAKRMMLVK